MGHKLVSQIKKAAKPATKTLTEVNEDKAQKATAEKGAHILSRRVPPGSPTQVVEVRKAPMLLPSKDYVTLDVKGSGGKIYRVVIPQSYEKYIPRKWKWDTRRYRVAELISAGLPVTRVAKETGVFRSVIYAWLQHPEFKEHVDGLILETGWANKQERIAGLNKVTSMLFDKVVNELKHLPLSDKSIGPVLVAIQTIAKQIAQEKDEFVEQAKVENNTNLSGVIGVATANIDALMNSKSAEERRALEGEFKAIGDDIIRGITGEKE